MDTSGNGLESSSPVLNLRSASIQACSLSFVFVITLTFCHPRTNSISSTSPSVLRYSVKYWNDLSKRILTSPIVTTNVLIAAIFRNKLPNRFGLMERKCPYPHLERSNSGFELSYTPLSVQRPSLGTVHLSRNSFWESPCWLDTDLAIGVYSEAGRSTTLGRWTTQSLWLENSVGHGTRSCKKVRAGIWGKTFMFLLASYSRGGWHSLVRRWTLVMGARRRI
jgi:hypothetical protein